MKIFFRFIYVAIYLILLAYILIFPSNNISFKLYKGKQANTVTEITLIPLDIKVNIKRLPLDNLWLSPLTLVPYVNVGFVTEGLKETPKLSLISPIDENTLGYCYLLALQESGIRLPLLSSLDKNEDYNIKDYVGEEFTLSDLKSIPDDIMKSFLKSVSVNAKTDMISIKKPVENSIAETSDKNYLFIYAVNNNRAYVIDPKYPQNLHNYIENNKYHMYMDTYEIKSYYKIAGDIN